MENMIRIFENEEFGKVRTLQEDDSRILFCGKDVATALGYRDTVNALKAHCKEDGVVIHHLTDSLGRKQSAKFISEGNLYRLTTHSRLPSAEKFESWIFDEVLPTIRRTGGYVANEDMFIENYLPFLDEPYRNLFRLQMAAINKLNERIRHDEPLVEFANQVSNTDNLIDMNAMAKLAIEENIPRSAASVTLDPCRGKECLTLSLYSAPFSKNYTRKYAAKLPSAGTRFLKPVQ